MKLNWKKNFKPKVVLEKISKIMTVNKDGSISFSGFEYLEIKATLYNMISFPDTLTSIQNNSLVDAAIIKAAKNDLTAETLMAELKSLFEKELSKTPKKYHLLTSLSIKAPLPQKEVTIGQSKIRFVNGDFPQKYDCRNEIFVQAKRKSIEFVSPPSEYMNVIVSTNAKSEHKATSQCLNDLDLLRAIWSLEINSGMELIGNKWSPINKIRLSNIQTLHKKSGENIDIDTYWFEPNYKHTKLVSINSKDLKIISKNSKWVIKQLSKCKYSDKLENALIRYVRALDESDQNVALLHIWGALESLTAYETNNKDKLPRRCAYLFNEYEYHKQILENLRDYRNQSVHSGDRNEEAKSYCYQLQGYFKMIMFFHLHRVEEFNTLEEANNFLDQPVTIIDIENSRKDFQAKCDLLDKVKKFRTVK
jgi:hypothetical protein